MQEAGLLQEQPHGGEVSCVAQLMFPVLAHKSTAELPTNICVYSVSLISGDGVACRLERLVPACQDPLPSGQVKADQTAEACCLSAASQYQAHMLAPDSGAPAEPAAAKPVASEQVTATTNSLPKQLMLSAALCMLNDVQTMKGQPLSALRPHCLQAPPSCFCSLHVLCSVQAGGQPAHQLT